MPDRHGYREEQLTSRYPQHALRPGDGVERLGVHDDDSARRLIARAGEAGLRFDTAVTVSMEHRLLLDELTAHGDAAIASLDAIARAARITVLPDRWSANYLRMLHHLNPDAKAPPAPSDGLLRCLTSGRLWTRLRRAGRIPLKLPDVDLGAAIAWEAAALIDGLTMTEWAYRTLLTSGGAAPGLAGDPAALPGYPPADLEPTEPQEGSPGLDPW